MFPEVLTLPTPKVFLIWCKTPISSICKLILKTNLNPPWLGTIEKLLSPSAKPTNQDKNSGETPWSLLIEWAGKVGNL